MMYRSPIYGQTSPWFGSCFNQAGCFWKGNPETEPSCPQALIPEELSVFKMKINNQPY